MASPDGTLTATAVAVDDKKTILTLNALWCNRGSLAINLCATHSIVEAFQIAEPPSMGQLRLTDGACVVRLATVRADWDVYTMEPNTDSVMHGHFVVDSHQVHGFRWTICLEPGSLPGKQRETHLVCSRELIWRNDAGSVYRIETNAHEITALGEH